MKWIILYRGWPLRLHDDAFRRMVSLVGRAQATQFPTREAARTRAFECAVNQQFITIEPVHP